MKHYTIALAVVAGAVASAAAVAYYMPAKIETVNEVKTTSDKVEELVDSIMASPEFTAEMRNIATARAQYIISNELQNEAVELAQMAMQSYYQTAASSTEWAQLYYESLQY